MRGIAGARPCYNTARTRRMTSQTITADNSTMAASCIEGKNLS